MMDLHHGDLLFQGPGGFGSSLGGQPPRPLQDRSTNNNPLRHDMSSSSNTASRHNTNNHNNNSSGSEVNDIEALQNSFAAMEDFFQSLLGQAHLYMEAMDPNNNTSLSGRNGGPPPASEECIENLPHMLWTADYLLALEKDGGDDKDESHGNNLHDTTTIPKTCEICCDDFEVNTEVTRLPCGHIFHGPCVTEWLQRHCTCPVCRYELVTDDESYEPGRLERMKDRQLPPFHHKRASTTATTAEEQHEHDTTNHLLLEQQNDDSDDSNEYYDVVNIEEEEESSSNRSDKKEDGEDTLNRNEYVRTST
mmetsp:Transcript_26575/g.37333  ORF Transcript_26575/g.37333 Transcript_26575/m.37333 type:complete len:307 (+) Transcript_26575:699-1619(+)